MIIMHIYCASDGRDREHQVAVPCLAVVGYHKGFVLGYQALFFKHIHIFDDCVFAFADRFADYFVAGITSVGSPVLAAHQKGIDSYFLCRKPKIKDRVRHRKEILHREGTVILSLRRHCILCHELSSTHFATHALTSGVDAKTLSGILGHTNASFTLDTYTHVTTNMQKNAAVVVGDFIDELFGGDV